LKDSTFFDLFADPRITKPPVIESMIQALPERQFVLVGDSGQKDPEIYGEIARKHPREVLFVFIRGGNDETESGERFTGAFTDVPRRKWRVFRKAEDLLDIDLRPAATQPATSAGP
jgi:phosphatidate phosphatase APP1